MTAPLALGESQVRMFVCPNSHQWPVVVKRTSLVLFVAHEPGANICPQCQQLGTAQASNDLEGIHASSVDLIHASACAPMSATQADVERAVNDRHPTGLDHDSHISDAFDEQEARP